MGALVLRSQRNGDHSGYLQSFQPEDGKPLPDIFEQSSMFLFPDGSHGSIGSFFWGVNNYPRFLFDLLACIRGTRTSRVSSFYGMDFENPVGSRLFS